ncbi:hypothetical protein PTKIN_Ptkin10aG0016800 [Pterospermum kingtungense]
MAKKVLERYSRDPNFRFPHERVSDMFAEALKADMGLLKSGAIRNIGLAAKWCPSIDSSFDKSTLLCESIAKKIFPQVYIGANRWDSIPYNGVASVALKFYKEKFLNHDKERFSKYLEDGKLGNLQLRLGSLETAWRFLTFSGSMSGIPMEVSVALGVLVSELSEEPWKGKLITCSSFCTRQIEARRMIKRLFVLSDMEFDQASASPWETNCQIIVNQDTEKGYGDAIPQIVFWNLRNSRATPVPASQNGVALVSGFSKNLMKMET